MKLKQLRLLTAVFFSSIILMACSNPFDQLADEINNVIDGSSTEEESENSGEEENSDEAVEVEEETTDEEVAQEEETDPMYERIDYSHLYGEGEETTIDEGEHTAGEDIVPGRYSITTDAEHSAYLRVYDEEENHVAGEVLTSGEGSTEYPTEVLVYLDEGNNIEVGDNQTFELTPASTEYDETLPSGMHVAGQDIEAGDYRVSIDETEQVGHVETSHAPAFVTSRNAVGNPEEGGRESFVMTINERDIVHVTAVSSVNLEKLD